MSPASKPRYLTAKQHKVNPVLAGHLERIADFSLEPHHKEVGTTVEKFKARRAAVHTDNRGLTPKMLRIWKTEIVPKLPVNHGQLVRHETLAEQHFGGASKYREELVTMVAKILEHEPRLLQEKRLLGLRTVRKDPRAMAAELVNGVIQARADALHDKTTLKPELSAMRSAAVARHDARKIVAANAQKIFEIMHTKQTSKKRQDLQKIVKLIITEFDKLNSGQYWSSTQEGNLTKWTAKTFSFSDFAPIALRILSQQPSPMYESEYARYNFQLLLAAFEHYGVPLTQPPKSRAKKAT